MFTALMDCCHTVSLFLYLSRDKMLLLTYAMHFLKKIKYSKLNKVSPSLKLLCLSETIGGKSWISPSLSCTIAPNSTFQTGVPAWSGRGADLGAAWFRKR